MKRFVLLLLLCAAPIPALAHKVLLSVFPSGDVIEGEVGFSNGTMAVDQLITVRAPDGTVLGETTTDSDGFFLFKPVLPVAHIFRGNLGAGHVAEVKMPAQEVAAIMGKPVQSFDTATTSGAVVPADGAMSTPPLSSQQRAAIAEIMRDEIRPLRREMAATREHRDLQSILGGIGYIVGLFGLGFYLAARRKLAA
jgi:nickel transport protein